MLVCARSADLGLQKSAGRKQLPQARWRPEERGRPAERQAIGAGDWWAGRAAGRRSMWAGGAGPRSGGWHCCGHCVAGTQCSQYSTVLYGIGSYSVCYCASNHVAVLYDPSNDHSNQWDEDGNEKTDTSPHGSTLFQVSYSIDISTIVCRSYRTVKIQTEVRVDRRQQQQRSIDRSMMACCWLLVMLDYVVFIRSSRPTCSYTIAVLTS